MSEKIKPLPSTSFLVLGLLSFGRPLSGYEIRQQAQTLRFFYWSPAQSQIYGELNRLAERGLATGEEVAQEGKPDKRLYTITAAGEAALAAWLGQEPPEATVIKNMAALKLYFGHATSPEALQLMLERFIAETKERLGQMAIVQEYLAEARGMAYPSLVVEWSYELLEADLRGAERMLARLQAGLQSTPTKTDPI